MLPTPEFGKVEIPAPEQVSFGTALINEPGFRDLAAGKTRSFSVTLDAEGGMSRPVFQTRTTLNTTGLTSIQKLPDVVQLGQQPLTAADLLAQGTTDAPTVRYIRESSFTNAATTVAEGGTKPEAAFATAEVDAPVRKISVTAKVTDELIQDFPAVASFIDARLRFMVLTTEEAQLLNGNGSGTNLTGLLQTSGIQTQARGSDTQLDALFKGITKVRQNAFAEPSGIIVNPADAQTLRLAKDSNGQYFGGGPMFTPYGNGPFTRMVNVVWGLPMIVTTQISAGVALIGDFARGAQIFRKQGITIEATNSNEDDFRTNKIAIRVEESLAFAVYLPPAFCQVSGL